LPQSIITWQAYLAIALLVAAVAMLVGVFLVD